MSEGKMVQSLVRGMDILVSLSETPGNLPLKTIAERMGLKPTTVHNLLRTLRAKGFVEQAPGSQEYRLGHRLAELLAARSLSRFYLSLEKLLLELHSEFPDATLTFVEPVGGEISVRLRLSSDLPGRLQHPHDTTFSLYSSASGLAILSFATDEQRSFLSQRHPLLEEGLGFWQTPEKLENFLNEARGRGLVKHPFSGKNQYAMAVPVYENGVGVSGAIGFCVQRHKDGESPAEPALEAAEKHIKLLIEKYGLHKRKKTGRT